MASVGEIVGGRIQAAAPAFASEAAFRSEKPPKPRNGLCRLASRVSAMRRLTGIKRGHRIAAKEGGEDQSQMVSIVH